jgi:hypothetical protein
MVFTIGPLLRGGAKISTTISISQVLVRVAIFQCITATHVLALSWIVGVPIVVNLTVGLEFACVTAISILGAIHPTWIG